MKRLELKYHTKRKTADAIFHELEKVLDIDKNSKNSTSYENVNIYYDDTEMRSYLEKHEGDNVRSKVRLRMSRPYGTKTFTRLQIEIKERRGIEVLKRKFPVAVEDQQWAINNLTSYMLKKHEILIKDFLHPATGVRYIRTAVDSAIFPGLRITFDTDIKSFHSFKEMEKINAQFLLLPIADCLIEIKLAKTVPALISHIIQKHNLQRVTYSKYAKSLENTHQTFDNRITAPEYY